MLGRATRTYDRLNKTHFEIFDCVGLCEAFMGMTNIKPVAPNKNTTFKVLKEALEKAESNEEKGNIVKKVIAKLQREKKLICNRTNLYDFLKDGKGNRCRGYFTTGI